MLKDWMPKRGRRRPVYPKGYDGIPERYVAKTGIPMSRVPEAEAERAWSVLAEGLGSKLGIDFVNSESASVWEAFDYERYRVDPREEVSTTLKGFILLFEEFPEAGYRIKQDRLRFGDLPRPFGDLCLAPWPSLTWVTMITHEEGFGPYRVDLK